MTATAVLVEVDMQFDMLRQGRAFALLTLLAALSACGDGARTATGSSASPEAPPSSVAESGAVAAFCSNILVLADEIREDLGGDQDDSLALLEAIQSTTSQGAEILEENASDLSGEAAFDAEEVIDSMIDVAEWTPFVGGSISTVVESMTGAMETFIEAHC